MDSVGSPSRTSKLMQGSRALRTLGLDAESAARRVNQLDQSHNRANRSGMSLFQTVRSKLGPALKDMSGVLLAVGRPGGRLAGMASMAGLAGQAIGSLAGGAVILTPRLVELGGAAAALIPTFVGLIGLTVNLKTVTQDLSKAMAGGPGGMRALRQMGGAGASLVRQLRAARFELRQLSRAGTTPIYQAASRAFPAIRQRLIPTLRGVNAQIGGAIGGSLTQLSSTLMSRSSLAAITNIGGQGAAGIRATGDALSHLSLALERIGVAAAPLTRFLTQTIRAIGLWADRTTAASSSTGRLQGFFVRLTSQVRQMFRFLTNTGHLLRAVFRDALPASNALYGTILNMSERWRRMADSTAWNSRQMSHFLGLLPGLQAMGRLAVGLAKAIYGMGGQSGLPRVANSLTRALPALTRFLNTMANTFGPVLGNLVQTLSTTLMLLGGQSGPLVQVLNGLNGILGLVNSILRAIGPFRGIVAKAFEIGLMVRFLSKMGLISLAWQRATASAAEYAAVSSGAMGGGPVIGLGSRTGFLGGLFRRGGSRGGFRALGGLSTMSAEGRTLAMETPALGFGLSTSAAEGGVLSGLFRGGGLLGAGKIAGGLVGRIALPLMAIQGLFGALTAARSGSFGHQAAQTAYGGVNAATGGLLGAGLGAIGFGPILQTPGQKSQRLIGLANSRLTREGVGQTPFGNENMRRLNHDVDVLQYTMRQFAGDQTDAAKQYRQQLQQEIDARKALIASMQAEAAQHSGAKSTADTSPWARLLRQGGPAAVERNAAQQLGTIGGAANAAERYGIERRLLRGTPAARRAQVMASVHRFDPNVVYGPTVQGDKGSYGGVYNPNFAVVNGQVVAMTGRAQRGDIMAGVHARDRLQMRHLGMRDPIAQALLASLESSGFTRANGFNPMMWVERWLNAVAFHSADPSKTPLVPPSVWRQLGRQQRRTAARRNFDLWGAGAGHATGGRLGGFGASDTVSLGGGMAAPGELVVNRHTERSVNTLLAQHGRSLSGMVNGEDRRHSGSFAKGGRVNWAGQPPLTGQIAGIVGMMEQRFPNLVPTSTIRSDTHGVAGHSYHDLGMAADLAGGSQAYMDQAGAWAASNLMPQLLEGIHNPTLSVKNGQLVTNPLGFWGTDPSNGQPIWLEHFNHIHLAASNAGRAAPAVAGGAPAAAAAPGAATTTQAQRIRAAARGHMVTDILGTTANLSGLGGLGIVGDQGPIAGAPGGAAGAPRSGPGTSLPGTMTSTAVFNLLTAAGFSANVARNFVGIANAESGLRPGALNNNPATGDYSVGLWQENFFQSLGPARTARYAPRFGLSATMAPGAFVAWLQTHPAAQAAIAHDLFSSSGYAPWRGDAFVSSHPGLLAKGGRLGWGGWHAGGMDATFSSPTLIGVGERGAERVTVTPHGRGGKGTVTMHNTFHITGGPEVQRQVEVALHKLADELERFFGADDGSEVA